MWREKRGDPCRGAAERGDGIEQAGEIDRGDEADQRRGKDRRHLAAHETGDHQAEAGRGQFIEQSAQASAISDPCSGTASTQTISIT
jgi:hypothetical protein